VTNLQEAGQTSTALSRVIRSLNRARASASSDSLSDEEVKLLGRMYALLEGLPMKAELLNGAAPHVALGALVEVAAQIGREVQVRRDQPQVLAERLDQSWLTTACGLVCPVLLACKDMNAITHSHFVQIGSLHLLPVVCIAGDSFLVGIRMGSYQRVW
jgi:hypothetical protein